MKKIDVAELRSKIDMTGRYVDFAILRSALTVSTVARDSGVQLTEPTFDGECRGTCPKCSREKSFTVNVNNNRFNCFGKDCTLKGAGVIDFFSKLNQISAKDTSHLLAYAYGIQPYSSEPVPEEAEDQSPKPAIRGKGVESSPSFEVPVTRSEFNELKARFDKLSKLIFVYALGNDDPGGIAEDYDPPLTSHHVTQ